VIIAVVVTYNPEDNLQYLLERASEQVDVIILVDNGSSNKVFIEQIMSNNQAVHFVVNRENCGLAIALNQGIEKGLALGASHFLLLDQDTSLGDNMVDMLMRDERALLERGEKVAVIGPKLVDIQSGKSIPFVRQVGFKRIRSSKNNELHCIADHVITSGSLINRCVIDEVGLMWVPLFIDYIDVEWCHRARSLGYQVYGSSTATMQHDIGERRFAVPFTARQIPVHSSFRVFYLIRNLVWISRLPYFTRSWGISEFVRVIAKVSVETLFCKDRYARGKAVIMGLWHGTTKFPKDEIV
jgi:rhamnosyltransferase